MDEKENKSIFVINSENNEYTIILKLKLFKQRTKNIESMDDLNIIISEVKDFIFRVPVLKSEYQKQLEFFNNYSKNNPHIYKRILRGIHKLLEISNNLKIDTFNIEPIYYYYSLKPIMENNNGIDAKPNIACFYYLNMCKYYEDKGQIGKIIKSNIGKFLFGNSLYKPLLDTVNFAVINFENYLTLGYVHWGDQEFFRKWFQSALTGILDLLERNSKQLLQNDIELKNIVNHEPLAELYNFINLIKEHPNWTYTMYADKLCKSKETLKTQCKEICQKIYQVAPYEQNQGLKRVKELVLKEQK